MKTVTMTTQNAYNYGGTLQAYALNNTLRNMEVDDIVLDFYRDTRDEYYRQIKVCKTLHRDLFNNFMSFIHKRKLDERKRRFDKFVRDNIKTTKRYLNIDDLKRMPPEADVFITGGDQMMNVSRNHMPKEHLNFREQFEFEILDAKRISYSTSMGSELTIVNGYEEEFKKRLSEYDSLSVREDNTKDFLEKLTGRLISSNIDPVFLLNPEEWKKFADSTNIKYILVYSLLNNSALNEIIGKVKKDTGLEVWVINPWARCYTKGDKIIRDAGPKEFISLIKNAQYVISTSFHGVCFSIIFEKEFYCLVKKGGDIRYESMLRKFSLDNRIVRNASDIDYPYIDYEPVKEIVRKEKQRSISYLKEALNI